MREAESAAEVDDARPGGDQHRREFHRSLRRSGQENDRKLLPLNGLRSEIGTRRPFGFAQRGGMRRIPVVEQNGRGGRVSLQEPEQLRPAVSAISDNAYPMVHGFLFATMNNYNTSRRLAECGKTSDLTSQYATRRQEMTLRATHRLASQFMGENQGRKFRPLSALPPLA